MSRASALVASHLHATENDLVSNYALVAVMVAAALQAVVTAVMALVALHALVAVVQAPRPRRLMRWRAW